MFTEFTVKDFRCFSELRLERLERINLIAGKNNTGKTALLEAIDLHNHPNGCQLALEMNKLRGVSQPGKAFGEVLSWLFRDKQGEAGLELSSTDDNSIKRSLTLSLLDATTARERLSEDEKRGVLQLHPDLWAIGSPTLLMRYEQTNEQQRLSWASPAFQLAGVGMNSCTARLPWSIGSIYVGSTVSNTDADAEFFAKLALAKREKELLPALQIMEPRLKTLALLPLAGESVVHGDIGRPNLVPISFMGEGMRRMLSILLAIANATSGVVLIDEIENGLHYSVQKKVWKAIAQAARQENVQVFATTHSYQCIDAAHDAFRESGSYDFRLFRLDRVDNSVTVTDYDQESLDAAMKFFMEVR